eukprot:2409172-Prymnesium_polylepis.1
MAKVSPKEPLVETGPHTCGTEILSHLEACPTVVGLPIASTCHVPLVQTPSISMQRPLFSVRLASHARHDPVSDDVPQSRQSTSAQPTVNFHSDPGTAVPFSEMASTRQAYVVPGTISAAGVKILSSPVSSPTLTTSLPWTAM